MKKILVAGSTGFIGKHLVAFLKRKDYEIFESGSSADINLCNSEHVKLLPATDIIIHLAGRSFVPDSFVNPASFYHNNFTSTLNMLELARKNASSVIFFSTYVYGTPLFLPINEEHRTSPLNPYTQSKLLCEELCQSYFRDFQVPVTIFRPFNVYGPGQSNSFLIPRIIGQLKNEVVQLSDPLPRRDFIFIDDILEAVHLSILAHSKSFEIFNLGSGTSVSVGELVALIKRLSNSDSKIVYTNIVRQGEIQETIADVSRIQKGLGWLPKTSITEGLTKTIEGSAV